MLDFKIRYDDCAHRIEKYGYDKDGYIIYGLFGKPININETTMTATLENGAEYPIIWDICQSCEKSITVKDGVDGNYYICDDCEDTYCKDCRSEIITCMCCGDTICHKCINECPHCEGDYCDDCLIVCESCGEEVCSECFNSSSGFCDECDDEEEDW